MELGRDNGVRVVIIDKRDLSVKISHMLVLKSVYSLLRRHSCSFASSAESRDVSTQVIKAIISTHNSNVGKSPVSTNANAI